MAFTKRSVAIKTTPLDDSPRPGRPGSQSDRGDVSHLLRRGAHECHACGYEMSASDGDTCPECGARRR